LAADIYPTVHNFDTIPEHSPTYYSISPNHPRNKLAEHPAFFDSQTKTKN